MPVQYREFAQIDTAVRLGESASHFRVTYGADMIEVFRRLDFDVEDMLATFGIGERSGEPPRSGSQPLLRFLLQDEQTRAYAVELYENGMWRQLAEGVAPRDLLAYVRQFTKV